MVQGAKGMVQGAKGMVQRAKGMVQGAKGIGRSAGFSIDSEPNLWSIGILEVWSVGVRAILDFRI
jgi:hypothetical protein